MTTPAKHAFVELPVATPYAMIRVRVRDGQVVAKSWRVGRRERHGWRSMRSERLSRIRRLYWERRR